MVTFQTASGDGQVQISDLSAKGTYGNSSYDFFAPNVGLSTVDASSNTYIRIGTSGARIALSDVADTGFAESTASSAVSNPFAIEQNGQTVNVNLTQALRDIEKNGARVGGQLEQVYTFSNPSNSEIFVEFFRYADIDLSGSGTYGDDGGGRLVVDGADWLFMTDTTVDADTETELVAVRLDGGEDLPGTFDIDQYGTLANRIAAGDPLLNSVRGDGNDADELVDIGNGRDLGVARGKGIRLAAGASATLKVYTAYGQLSLGEITELAPSNPDPVDPDPVVPGPVDPIIPNPGATALTPVAEAKVLEVTQLGTANTISLQLQQVGINSVSDLLIFATDALGNNRTQIGSFSLLKGGQLPTAYSPEFTLDSSQIAEGQFLQFELIQNGVARTATATLGKDGQIELDFGDGTRLLAALTNQTSTTNLLRDDAATIDLTGITDPLSVEFMVYREAAFNNTVGLYRTDDAGGGIADPLTGNVLNPGDEGYKAAALARQLDVRLTGQNGQVSSFSADVLGGGFLGMFLVVNGTDPLASEVYFSHMGANTDGSDHAKALGNNTFGFEDMAGLGDRDFNDVVVKFAIV